MQVTAVSHHHSASPAIPRSFAPQNIHAYLSRIIQELLEKFAINTESMMTPETCKVLAVINRRSPVTVPDFNLASRDQR